VRDWAAVAEVRGAELLEPTLARVQNAERKRARQTAVGYAIATVFLLVLPWSRPAPELTRPAPKTQLERPSAAAIERVEAGDKRAQVFVLGGSTTPVVWLADDAPEDEAPYLQDPG
jgi:hypothetical protein